MTQAIAAADQHIRDQDRPEWTLCVQIIDPPSRRGFITPPVFEIAESPREATCLRCRAQARRDGFEIDPHAFDDQTDCDYCGGTAPVRTDGTRWEGFCAECQGDYSAGWNEAVAGADMYAERNVGRVAGRL